MKPIVNAASQVSKVRSKQVATVAHCLIRCQCGSTGLYTRVGDTNLTVSGDIKGPIQPAPHGSGWYKRLARSETARILCWILQCEDADLLSHSLKATTLSWSEKANMARECRRLLERHTSSIKDSYSFYSRDLLVAPVRALSAVIRLIQQGIF